VMHTRKKTQLDEPQKEPYCYSSVSIMS